MPSYDIHESATRGDNNPIYRSCIGYRGWQKQHSGLTFDVQFYTGYSNSTMSDG